VYSKLADIDLLRGRPAVMQRVKRLQGKTQAQIGRRFKKGRHGSFFKYAGKTVNMRLATGARVGLRRKTRPVLLQL